MQAGMPTAGTWGRQAGRSMARAWWGRQAGRYRAMACWGAWGRWEARLAWCWQQMSRSRVRGLEHSPLQRTSHAYVGGIRADRCARCTRAYKPACLGHAQATVGLRCPRASASSDHCAGCSTLRRADHRTVRTATVPGSNTSRGLWQTPAASLTCQQQQRHQRPGNRSGTHDCRWQHVECYAVATAGGVKAKHVWARCYSSMRH